MLTAPEIVTRLSLSVSFTWPPLATVKPAVTVPALRLTVPAMVATGLPVRMFQIAPEPPVVPKFTITPESMSPLPYILRVALSWMVSVPGPVKWPPTPRPRMLPGVIVRPATL